MKLFQISVNICELSTELSGGAGGKGVWGTPGQVYDVEEVDVKDPNYDDDQVSAIFFYILNVCRISWFSLIRLSSDNMFIYQYSIAMNIQHVL